jgi:hypothetical protein
MVVLSLRQSRAGQVVIAVQFASKAVLLVIKLLVHCDFLPFVVIISEVLAAVLVRGTLASSHG